MNRDEGFSVIKAHQKAAPVQTVPIANALGLDVYRVPSFSDDLSGMIRKEDDDKFVIYVNGNHPTVRRRFTIAHEIAHYVLHKDRIGSGLTDDAMYRSGLTSQEETEANRLAADILMPWHLLAEDEVGSLSVAELARKYQVSKVAMGIRLGVPAGALEV